MVHWPRVHLGTTSPTPELKIPTSTKMNTALLLLALLGTGALMWSWRPFARAEETEPSTQRMVLAVVSRYVNDWDPILDPLITLENGLQAKSSNFDGINIRGERYYYRILNHPSFDPVARGELGEYVPVAVLDPGTDWETEIYRKK